MHAAEWKRTAFEDWVDATRKFRTPDRAVRLDDRTTTAHELLLDLARCTDIMPAALCDELSLPPGSTYAQGVALFLNEAGGFSIGFDRE